MGKPDPLARETCGAFGSGQRVRGRCGEPCCGSGPRTRPRTELAEAANRLRAERLNEVEALGAVYRIARTRRLLRWGPDGPEGPRPSGIGNHDPSALHLSLDEDGTMCVEEASVEDAP
ncbi:DUF5954 family protein [Streptomyces sp. NPDC057027]|uniref:DUF5954 family protein n=1 Tax=Streptomyces sp. NPDC057027 TaxID=3346004 RepID=UPI0036301155